MEDHAEQALKKAKAPFAKKGIKVKLVLEAGLVPANNIIQRAKAEKADLVLLGSTGLTGLKRVLIGSTAAKVVANAPCSVSVIR